MSTDPKPSGTSSSIEDDEAINISDGHLLPIKPVEIAMKSHLACAMQTDSWFFRMYEITACPKADDLQPRFLSTMGIFSCVAIFGWSPSSLRAFAAHVPISACHYAIGTKNKRENLIPQITKALQWTFRKEDISKVQLYLVGGQKFQDSNDRLLHRVFKGEKRFFSWHVRRAVLDAGIAQANIDERYLNVFPGIPFNPAFEQQQAMKNQSFQLAALDRVTGAMIVHTKSVSATNYVVPALERRGIYETNRYAQALRSYAPEGQECAFVKAEKVNGMSF